MYGISTLYALSYILVFFLRHSRYLLEFHTLRNGFTNFNRFSGFFAFSSYLLSSLACNLLISVL